MRLPHVQISCTTESCSPDRGRISSAILHLLRFSKRACGCAEPCSGMRSARGARSSVDDFRDHVLVSGLVIGLFDVGKPLIQTTHLAVAIRLQASPAKQRRLMLVPLSSHLGKGISPYGMQMRGCFGCCPVATDLTMESAMESSHRHRRLQRRDRSRQAGSTAARFDGMIQRKSQHRDPFDLAVSSPRSASVCTG